MTINIGKAADNELKIQEPDVSRYHARLTRQDLAEEWLLDDLNSTNGTFVNDRQIQKKRIGKSDKIRMGSSCLL